MTQYYLDQWLQQREDIIEKTRKNNPNIEIPDSLIIQKWGQRLTNPCYDWYNDRLKKMGERVGIPNLCSHTLRRSWGKEANRKGVRIPIIAKFYGHQKTSTTDRYILADQDEMVETIMYLHDENQQTGFTNNKKER